MASDGPLEALAHYPLLDALRGRRSRRFGLGMAMDCGPFAYKSRHAPLPLSEDEEALLAFAACGISGYALADLVYAEGQGGTIMAGLTGRTVSSPDAIQTVALAVTNDEATYLLKRPQDLAPAEIPELIALAKEGRFAEVYRRSRVRIKEGRTAPSKEPLFNLNCNQWSLYAPGGTYFVPINDFTFLYINGVLEVFNETTAIYVLDERANFQPAGIKRFAKSKGGFLDDSPGGGRIATIQRIENLVTEFVTIEQGMMLQNLGLMAQAIGLGGFPHWAAHEFGWLQALGFRMAQMPTSRYLGMSRALATLAGLTGRDQPVPYALGLEKDGAPLLKSYCPPYYPSMEAAVRAVVDCKFGEMGIFRGGAVNSAWSAPDSVSSSAPACSEASIEATIAYCDYIYQRYGRFPAYAPPFRTVLGYQATHVDTEFYDRFYRPDALTDQQRLHLEQWHSHL